MDRSGEDLIQAHATALSQRTAAVKLAAPHDYNFLQRLISGN